MTDEFGAYLITDVPVSDYDVTASASEFVSSTTLNPVTVTENTETTDVDFALDPAPAGSPAIVHCITYNTKAGPNQDKHLEIIILIVDELDNAVENATVFATVTGDSTFNFSASTDSTGIVTFTIIQAPNATYATNVTDITNTALTFNGDEPTNSFTKSGGTQQTQSFGDCTLSPSGTLSRVPPGPRAVRAAIAVQGRHEAALMSNPNVVGVAISALPSGQPVIKVFLAKESAGTRAQLPTQLENIPVLAQVTGEFVSRIGCSLR